MNTNGSADLLLGNQTMLHLVAPLVLTNGLTQADVIVTTQSPAVFPYPGFVVLAFQLNGLAQIQFANFSLQPLPLVPSLSVTPALTNSSALDLQWYGATNENYQVQYRTSLNQGAWTNLGSTVSAQGSAATLTTPISPNQPSRYYRVEMTLAKK